MCNGIVQTCINISKTGCFVCSNCGVWADSYLRSKYAYKNGGLKFCPNCGAKIDWGASEHGNDSGTDGLRTVEFTIMDMSIDSGVEK